MCGRCKPLCLVRKSVKGNVNCIPDGLDAVEDNATGFPRKAEAIPAVPRNIARRRHAFGGLMSVRLISSSVPMCMQHNSCEGEGGPHSRMKVIGV